MLSAMYGSELIDVVTSFKESGEIRFPASLIPHWQDLPALLCMSAATDQSTCSTLPGFACCATLTVPSPPPRGMHASAGLPPAVFAAAVPNNYNRQVLSIVEEVYADHNAMVRGH